MLQVYGSMNASTVKFYCGIIHHSVEFINGQCRLNMHVVSAFLHTWGWANEPSLYQNGKTANRWHGSNFHRFQSVVCVRESSQPSPYLPLLVHQPTIRPAAFREVKWAFYALPLSMVDAEIRRISSSSWNRQGWAYPGFVWPWAQRPSWDSCREVASACCWCL